MLTPEVSPVPMPLWGASASNYAGEEVAGEGVQKAAPDTQLVSSVMSHPSTRSFQVWKTLVSTLRAAAILAVFAGLCRALSRA